MRQRKKTINNAVWYDQRKKCEVQSQNGQQTYPDREPLTSGRSTNIS